jgi:hypothetical protein
VRPALHQLATCSTCRGRAVANAGRGERARPPATRSALLCPPLRSSSRSHAIFTITISRTIVEVLNELGADLKAKVRAPALLHSAAAAATAPTRLGCTRARRQRHRCEACSRPRGPPADSQVRTSEFTSKLHLVDLAGSERVKRSGVTGKELKEATHINR